jgi:TPR repeat protein
VGRFEKLRAGRRTRDVHAALLAFNHTAEGVSLQVDENRRVVAVCDLPGDAPEGEIVASVWRVGRRIGGSCCGRGGMWSEVTEVGVLGDGTWIFLYFATQRKFAFMVEKPSVKTLLALFEHDDASRRQEGRVLLERCGEEVWDEVFSGCSIDSSGAVRGRLPWSDQLLCVFLSRAERILGAGKLVRGLRLGHLGLNAPRRGVVGVGLRTLSVVPDEGLQVLNTGGPAAASGVLPDDVILAIDDTATAGLSLESCFRLLSGPPGESVHLRISRSQIADPLEISIVREGRVVDAGDREYYIGQYHSHPRRDRVGALDCLDACPELTHLDLSGVRASGPLVERLVGLGSLQHLDAFGMGLSDADCTAIKTGNPGCVIDRKCQAGTFIWYEPDGDGAIRIAASILPVWVDHRVSHFHWVAVGYSGGGCQEQDLAGRTLLDDDGVCYAIQGLFSPGSGRYTSSSRAALQPGSSPWKAGGHVSIEGPMNEEEEELYDNLLQVLWADVTVDEETGVVEPTAATIAKMRQGPSGDLYHWDGWCIPGFFIALMNPQGLLSSWPLMYEFEAHATGIRPRLPSFDVDGISRRHRIVFTVDCELLKEKYEHYGDQLAELGEETIEAFRAEIIADRCDRLRTLAADIGVEVVDVRLEEDLASRDAWKQGRPEDEVSFVMLTLSSTSLYALDTAILKSTGNFGLSFYAIDLDEELLQHYMPGEHDEEWGQFVNPAEQVRYRQTARKWRNETLHKLFPEWGHGTWESTLAETLEDVVSFIPHMAHDESTASDEVSENRFWAWMDLADTGEPRAQTLVGWCFFHGNGVHESAKKATEYYRLAAGQGFAFARAGLTGCYRKAAEQGDPLAQVEIASCYFHGSGVEEDKTEAVAWYRKAAEQGHAGSQYTLACCYKNGSGVEEDKAEAIAWYRKAAEQKGRPFKFVVDRWVVDASIAKAQYALAWHYHTGSGVVKDMAEAVRWFRLAAEQGHVSAQSDLGWCYQAGSGVAEDKAEAVRWYRLAAEQGHVSAQSNLGWCYQAGSGVAEDKAEAVAWYRKAAERGNAIAQYNLASCYQQGSGVEKDEAEAVAWYRKAAERGNANAQRALDDLA